MLAKMLAITAYLFRMHGAASKNTFKRDRGLYDFEILHISLYYANLEDLYDKCPAHDIKIVRGDLNAKVGQEGIFGNTAVQFSLHWTSSLNGVTLIDRARNMVPPGSSISTSIKPFGCLLIDQRATRWITL